MAAVGVKGLKFPCLYTSHFSQLEDDRRYTADLGVGASVTRYDVDGRQDVRLGEIGVEVEVGGGAVTVTHQSHSRLTTDVHSIDETPRQPQSQLMVVLRASRHVQHQRQINRAPAFYTQRSSVITQSPISPRHIVSRSYPSVSRSNSAQTQYWSPQSWKSA